MRAAPAALLPLVLAPLACGPAAAPAPAPSASGAAAAHAPAQLVAQPDAFDFGRVLPSQPLQKQFALRNLGREPLTISSVTTDCGCLVVEGYARELAPGAGTALTVVLNTPEQEGRVSRTVVVHTAAPHEESLALRLQATVVKAGS